MENVWQMKPYTYPKLSFETYPQTNHPVTLDYVFNRPFNSSFNMNFVDGDAGLGISPATDSDGDTLYLVHVKNVVWEGSPVLTTGSLSIDMDDEKTVNYVHEPGFVGDITFDYVVADLKGGYSEKSVTIHVVNGARPVITLNQGNARTFDSSKNAEDIIMLTGNTFSEPAGTVNDTEDGQIAWSSVVASDIDTTVANTNGYTVSYKVQDSDSNYGYASRKVYVLSPDGDEDNDGLTNAEELTAPYYTNPFSEDTDGDSIPDKIEEDNGLNPTDDREAEYSSDGDVYTDLEELLAGTDPNETWMNVDELSQYTLGYTDWYRDGFGFGEDELILGQCDENKTEYSSIKIKSKVDGSANKFLYRKMRGTAKVELYHSSVATTGSRNDFGIRLDGKGVVIEAGFSGSLRVSEVNGEILSSPIEFFANDNDDNPDVLYEVAYDGGAAYFRYSSGTFVVPVPALDSTYLDAVDIGVYLKNGAGDYAEVKNLRIIDQYTETVNNNYYSELDDYEFESVDATVFKLSNVESLYHMDEDSYAFAALPPENEYTPQQPGIIRETIPDFGAFTLSCTIAPDIKLLDNDYVIDESFGVTVPELDNLRFEITNFDGSYADIVASTETGGNVTELARKSIVPYWQFPLTLKITRSYTNSKVYLSAVDEYGHSYFYHVFENSDYPYGSSQLELFNSSPIYFVRFIPGSENSFLEPFTDDDGDGLPDEFDNLDSDGDGLSDADELENDLDPHDPNTGDTDGDGLSDVYEVTHGFDPNDEEGDLDGDGESDALEISWGSDPKSSTQTTQNTGANFETPSETPVTEGTAIVNGYICAVSYPGSNSGSFEFLTNNHDCFDKYGFNAVIEDPPSEDSPTELYELLEYTPVTSGGGDDDAVIEISGTNYSKQKVKAEIRCPFAGVGAGTTVFLSEGEYDVNVSTSALPHRFGLEIMGTGFWDDVNPESYIPADVRDGFFGFITSGFSDKFLSQHFNSGNVSFLVSKLDLNVDSNNDGIIEDDEADFENYEQEFHSDGSFVEFEEAKNMPGKIISKLNTGDLNKNYIPDYADETALGADFFTEMKLSLKYFNKIANSSLFDVTISFAYSQAEWVTGIPDPDDEVFGTPTYPFPGGGNLRIWKKNSNSNRNPDVDGGDLIQSGTEYKLSDIFNSEQRSLYIEAVNDKKNSDLKVDERDIKVTLHIKKKENSTIHFDYDMEVSDLVKVKVIDLQLEPITNVIDSVTGVKNPYAIAKGEKATYFIESDSLGYDDIDWVAEGSVSIDGEGKGHQVTVTAGDSTGDFTLKLKLKGVEGFEPFFKGEVVKQQIVNITLYIVSEDDGSNPATTEAEFKQLLAEVNTYLFKQPGMKFQVKEVKTIKDRSLLKLEGSKERITALFNEGDINISGISVFCVNEIGGGALGLQNAGRIICTYRNAPDPSCVPSVKARILGHELGHACNLGDIYLSKKNKDTGVTVSIPNASLPNKSMVEKVGEDWGLGLYAATLTRHNFTKRLLMYGRSDGMYGAPGLDIPKGKIEGISVFAKKEKVDVGFDDMRRDITPERHWNLGE